MKDHTHILPMPGIEAESLLAFLALVGLLRALEHAKPEWDPHVSWDAFRPWRARLHVGASVTESSLAEAAGSAVAELVEKFAFDGHRNVDFEAEEFRTYLRNAQKDETQASLACSLAAQYPEKRAGGIQAGPLVLMFGQGHQNFLDRLRSVPRGELPSALRKLKPPPDLNDPRKIAEALFAPWRRTDPTDAFRWDPSELQPYALRFDDPSSAGAAPTVHGANRLAALGLLSFACAPAADRARCPGTRGAGESLEYVWPLWSEPQALHGVEALLSHPDILKGDVAAVRALGVFEIMTARRFASGKFMNVAWGRPAYYIGASNRARAGR
jgi:hypothetical protein